MKILVTGASGFLGSRLCKELLNRGFSVWAQGRNQHKLSLLTGTKTIIADLSSIEGLHQVSRVLETEQMDGVVNAAALCDSWGTKAQFLKINTDAARELYRASVKHGVEHFIQISSPSVFASLEHQLNISENASFASPLNHYALSKQQAEKMLVAGANDSTKLTILRPQAIFGDGDPNLLPRLVQTSQLRGIPLINNGQHLIDITPVETVVQAICLCLEHQSGKNLEFFNVSNGEAYSFRELVEMIFGQIGETVNWKMLKLPIATTAANLMEGIGRITNSKSEPLLTRYALSVLAYSRTLNIEKARRELGFVPNLSVEDAVHQMSHGQIN